MIKENHLIDLNQPDRKCLVGPIVLKSFAVPISIPPTEPIAPNRKNYVDSTEQKSLAKIMRPEGFMDNPYIGDDGRDYHSLEALQRANQEYFDRMFPVRPNRRIE